MSKLKALGSLLTIAGESILIIITMCFMLVIVGLVSIVERIIGGPRNESNAGN